MRYPKRCGTYTQVILGNGHGHRVSHLSDVYGPKRVYTFRIFLRYVSTLLLRLGVAPASCGVVFLNRSTFSINGSRTTQSKYFSKYDL